MRLKLWTVVETEPRCYTEGSYEIALEMLRDINKIRLISVTNYDSTEHEPSITKHVFKLISQQCSIVQLGWQYSYSLAEVISALHLCEEP